MPDTARRGEHLRQHDGADGDARGQGKPRDGGRGDPGKIDLAEQEAAGKAVDPAHLHQMPVDGEDALHRVHIHRGHDDQADHKHHGEVTQAEPEQGETGHDDHGDGHAHPADRLEKRPQPGVQAGGYTEQPTEGGPDRQTDDHAFERDEQLYPERAAPGEVGQGARRCRPGRP